MRQLKLAHVLLALTAASAVATGCATFSSEVHCDLAAAKELPEDELDVTVFKVTEIVKHRRECRAQADAGPH